MELIDKRKIMLAINQTPITSEKEIISFEESAAQKSKTLGWCYRERMKIAKNNTSILTNSGMIR